MEDKYFYFFFFFQIFKNLRNELSLQKYEPSIGRMERNYKPHQWRIIISKDVKFWQVYEHRVWKYVENIKYVDNWILEGVAEKE